MLDECPNCGYKPCVAPGCMKHGNIDGRCVDHHVKRGFDSNLGRDNSDD